MREYDVKLVCMPFAMPMVAPLGLGVVCGALKKANISVKCHFLNIDLAERIPEEIYQYPAGDAINIDVMLSDWLYSEFLFGKSPERDDKFMEIFRKEDLARRIVWSKKCPSLESFLKNLPLLQREVNRSLERGATQVLQGNPKVVGCSSTFFQRLASIAMLKKIKELSPQTVTIIGGADCEGDAGLEAIKAFEFIDYLFSGDGDITVPEVVKQILDNRPVTLPYGVYNRQKAVQSNDKSEVACVDGKDIARANLDDFFERIKDSRLNIHQSKKYFLESSRGCWKGSKQHCSFCGLNGQRLCFRHKDTMEILAELRHAYFELGCRVFLTADTVLDMSALRGMFEEFSKEAPDALFCYESVSTLTEEQINILADNGIMIIQSGIETLIAKHSKLLNKGNDPLTSIALLKFCKERRIQVIWNMLSSIPGDDIEDYSELESLIPKITHLTGPSWGMIRFDKHSLYWQNPEQYNLKLKPMQCYEVLLPKNLVDIDKWAFFYDNLNPDAVTDCKKLRELGFKVKEWYKNTHPHCYNLEFNTKYEIHDTRPEALVEYYTLNEEEFKIMQLSRKPISLNKIINIYKNIHFVIEKLKKYNYILEMDGKILALPLIPPTEAQINRYRNRYRTLLKFGNNVDNRDTSYKVIEGD